MNNVESMKNDLMFKLGLYEIERLPRDEQSKAYNDPALQEEYKSKGFVINNDSGNFEKRTYAKLSDSDIIQLCLSKIIDLQTQHSETKEMHRRTARNTTILAVLAVLGVIFGVVTALIVLL